MLELFHTLSVIAQTDPSSALPAWLTGSSLAAILGYLLIRAERRLDEAFRRLDASEERYRTMVDKYAEKTYDAVSELGFAIEAIKSIKERGSGGG